MTDDRPRLYGQPYAEQMWTDPAEVWENDIEPKLCIEDAEGKTFEVEEWTAGPAYATTKNSAMWMQERVLEHVTEDWDEHGEHYDRLMKDPVLTDLFAQIDAHLAKEITYLMAEGLVGTHTITVMGGQPFWDGEPMYRTVQG